MGYELQKRVRIFVSLERSSKRFPTVPKFRTFDTCVKTLNVSWSFERFTIVPKLRTFHICPETSIVLHLSRNFDCFTIVPKLRTFHIRPEASNTYTSVSQLQRFHICPEASTDPYSITRFLLPVFSWRPSLTKNKHLIHVAKSR